MKKKDYQIICNENNSLDIIPVIVIEENNYDNFIKILPNFNKYSKYIGNKILNKELIISSKEFNKINHINKNNRKFFAECINIEQIYSKEKKESFKKEIKKYIKKYEILWDYFQEWVRILFNIIVEYILFIQKKNLFISIV